MKSMKKFKRILVISVIIILMILGMVWQGVMIKIETSTYTPMGQYVNVETFQAHYYSKGDGDKVFVFITGSGTPCAYTDFYALQNKLSDIGQTVTFDHPGSGWSEETKAERSIENLVKELSIIIDDLAPKKSVILICHSLGSLEAIGYAQENPERVKGIIFLDSGSPEFYSTDSELLAKIVNRSAAFTRVFGINRLLAEVGIFLPMYDAHLRNQKLPESLKDIDKAMYYKSAGNPASLNTINLINDNGAKVLESGRLGDIPILVLSSDSGHEWMEVQTQLASWSNRSKQITIKGSSHYLYWSNYHEVSDYIDEFINANKF